ncbi:MAG TPA: hydrogenase iron-sulfur subunit [Holophaga sp.]|nr:hydrogenase iron-sulfur subunit [Holophaga sp.]
MSDPKKTIIGFVCERSLPLEHMLDTQKALLDDPETKVVIVPCSGMVKPSFLESALGKGADATFVCGCAIGDCHYRTGNLMIRERLEGRRSPKLRKTTDRRKVGMFFVTMKDRSAFLEALAEFKAGLDPARTPEE